MLKKGGIYKQYKVIKTDGKRAIIKDATFSSNRKYVLSFLQNKNHFINLSNLNLPGFPKIIDEFYEKNYEYFIVDSYVNFIGNPNICGSAAIFNR